MGPKNSLVSKATPNEQSTELENKNEVSFERQK